MSRRGFVQYCQEENQRVFDGGPVLVQYKRKGNGEKVGVTVAFADKGIVYVGYSKCNTRQDKFNREIGLFKAFERAVPLGAEFEGEIPHSMRGSIAAMMDRATRFFRVEPYTAGERFIALRQCGLHPGRNRVTALLTALFGD